jgi:hypothetical protein
MKLYYFAPVLLLSAFLTTSSGSQIPEQRQQKVTKTYNDGQSSPRGTDERPFVVKAVPGPKSDDAAQYEKYQARTKPIYDLLDSAATVWIALITFVLAILNFILWLTTRKTAEAALKTAEALPNIERAYIFVTVIVLEDEMLRASKGKSFPPIARITVRIWNGGKTPAILTNLQVDVTEMTSGEPLQADIDKMGNEIAPGIFIKSGEYRDHVVQYPITPEEWKQVSRDDAWLVCYGCVEYRDVFGKPHETGFYWETDPLNADLTTKSPNIFTMSNNTDLNYYT